MFMNAAVFGALAVPNRLRIIEVLSEGPTPVGALAERLRLKQPLVSSHLKVLSGVGLVRVRPVAQQRLYELRPEPFEDIALWASAFQTIWSDRFDRLETQLRLLQDPPAGRPDQSELERGSADE